MNNKNNYSKKKIKKVFLMGVVAVVIIAFLAAIVKITLNNISDKTAYSNDYTLIYNCDYSKISKVTITNSETNTFIKGEDGWVCDNAPETVIGEKEFLKYLMNFKSIVGNLVQSSNADFGFDKPSAVITVTNTKGQTDKFILGNKADSNNGYYFKYENDHNTYLLSDLKCNFIFNTLNDFRTKTVFMPVVEDVLSISVKNANGSFSLSKFDTVNPSKNALLVSNWKITSPVNNQCKDEYITKNLFSNMVLETDGFYENSPELMKQYKLDNPQCVLKYSFIDQTTTNISFGEDIDGKVYVKIDGDTYIYRVPSRYLSVLTIKYHDLLSSLTEIEKIDNVTSINIAYNDVVHSITVEKTDGEIQYKCDDKPITKDAFNSVYDIIMSLYIEGNIELSGEGVFVCTISIEYNDGLNTKIIDFYTYEDEYAAIIVNGELNYFTSLNKVQSIIAEFEKLV